MTEYIMTCTCYFCKVQLPIDLAIEQGWVPEFYDEEDDFFRGPCCPACCKERLAEDVDSELVLPVLAK